MGEELRVVVTDTQAALLGGRYRLGPRIGVGGMAEVYRAEDLRLGRSVAVKLLRPETALDPQLRTRLEREAAAAAGLSHPNVVAVFDVGEDAGRPYLVMELMGGGSLAERLGRGPLDQESARRMTLGILGALAAAHRAGLLHRDIKPANILFSVDGTAKLADFGIAKALSETSTELDLTRPNVVMGTARYLAPERASGVGATVQSDIWAVGLVLYEALGGRDRLLPGSDGGVSADPGAPVAPVSSFRPGIDPRIDEIIRRALQPRPEARFASATDMADALNGAAPPDAAMTTVMETAPLPMAPAAAAVPAAAVPAAEPVGRWRVDSFGDRIGQQWRAVPVAGRAAAAMVAVALVALLVSLTFGGNPAPRAAATAPVSAGAASTTAGQLVAQVAGDVSHRGAPGAAPCPGPDHPKHGDHKAAVSGPCPPPAPDG